MEPTASAADRLLAAVELQELIVLALPLRDMLLARQVSRTWRDIVERSAELKEIRSGPTVTAELELPHECSLSSREPLKLYVHVTLQYDKPVTIRKVASNLSGKMSGFCYRIEQGDIPPRPYPAPTLGGCFRAKALQFNHENAWKYITLLPGTRHRLEKDFSVEKDPRRRNAVAIQKLGLNNTEVGKSYVLGWWPKLSLPAYVGTKSSLLSKSDAGENLDGCSFVRIFGHRLPLIGGEDVYFNVVA